MALQYPLVNGLRYDFSSIEIQTPAGIQNGIKEISYSDSLSPGKLRGTRAQVTGRTRGEYSAEGSMTMYKADWEEFIAKLSTEGSPVGFMEVSFSVVVNFSEAFETPRTNILHGCRITKTENSGSEGGDPLAVKIDLDILAIDHSGRGLFAVGSKTFLKP